MTCDLMKLILITNDLVDLMKFDIISKWSSWSHEVDIDNKWSCDLIKIILITNDLVI